MTTSADGTVRQWDATTGLEVETPYDVHFGSVADATYSPDGQFIASAGFDRTVRVWEASGRRGVAVLHGHAGPMLRVAFAPDGRRLASFSNSWIFAPGSRTAAVWDIAPESPPTVLNHADCVNSVVYSPDNRWLASGSSDYSVRLWNALTGECRATFPHPGAVPSLAFGPDGTWLVTVNHGDNKLRIWDVATARVREEIEGSFKATDS